MSQVEEKTIVNASADSDENIETSGAVREVVGNLFGQSTLNNMIRLGATALVVALDGTNPPQISGSVKESSIESQPDNSKPVKVNEIDNGAYAKHRQEVRSLLLNADSILARHHGEPITAKPVHAAVRPVANAQAPNRLAQASSDAERAPGVVSRSSVSPENNTQYRESQEKIVQEKAVQDRLNQIRAAQEQALKEQIAAELLSDINKRIDFEDLPEHITKSDDAQKYIEYARQNNQKVIMDFSSQGCGWCQKMDNEVYPQIDKSEYLVMKVESEVLEQSMRGFLSDLGIRGERGSGNINGFPYTAALGPGNDYQSAQVEQSGYMPLSEFKRLLNKVN